MDVTFFSIDSITDEEKQYKFIVTLKDNGKWNETEKLQEKNLNVNLGNGKASLGSSMFVRKTIQKCITIGIGKNKETGIIKSKFDTKIIKEPIRQYSLAVDGKKAGLFG